MGGDGNAGYRYDKMALNGGGIHCSICPLTRDSMD